MENIDSGFVLQVLSYLITGLVIVIGMRYSIKSLEKSHEELTKRVAILEAKKSDIETKNMIMSENIKTLTNDFKDLKTQVYTFIVEQRDYQNKTVEAMNEIKIAIAKLTA